jgi:hypothetical protein
MMALAEKSTFKAAGTQVMLRWPNWLMSTRKRHWAMFGKRLF